MGGDRRDLTLRLVRAGGKVALAELATRLGISEMTVRRDLDILARQGLVERVRGGAVACPETELTGGFLARQEWQAHVKDRIGRATVRRIEPHSTVLLDAGTTTVHVARHLIDRGPMTVAVLSLQAAVVLADQPGIRLLVMGGESRPGERSLVGPLALRAVDDLRFDVFVMSAGAVHPEFGWSEFALEDATVKQAALRRCDRAVVAADASKLGTRAFARIADLGAVAELVTDASAHDPAINPGAAETLTALNEAGVTVTFA
jgi:DeoR/GlpR family transcriptional regulator of sugar metabolism